MSNEEKLEYLVHSCDTKHCLPFFWKQFRYDTSGDASLRPSDYVKDLGVIVSADFKWERQINTMVNKATNMSAWVFSVFKCKHTTTMMTLYKSMVRS